MHLLRDFSGDHYVDLVLSLISLGMDWRRGRQARGEHCIISLWFCLLRRGFVRQSFNDRDVLYQIVGDSMTLLEILRAVVRD